MLCAFIYHQEYPEFAVVASPPICHHSRVCVRAKFPPPYYKFLSGTRLKDLKLSLQCMLLTLFIVSLLP